MRSYVSSSTIGLIFMNMSDRVNNENTSTTNPKSLNMRTRKIFLRVRIVAVKKESSVWWPTEHSMLAAARTAQGIIAIKKS